ncbi:MAG TPA: enolase C-terminal domain-like protein [Bryobacteraceae bacterium]|nr:enolase C-terminal domain-like protein [Bryobacteraceae bacterium]
MTTERISRRRLVAALAAPAGLAALPASAAGRSERLQITRIELFKVVVPMQDDITSSPELGGDDLTEFPKTPKFVVKLHTDSGIVGIGETPRGVKEENLRKSVAYLTGKNILDLNLSSLELPDRTGYYGFETALYDAVGKAMAWPIYRLLGGLAQRKVLVNYWCARKNPVDIKRVAQRAVAGHFKGVKMKAFPGDPVVKAVEAIASVSPDLKVTVDTEGRFRSAAEFLPVGKGLDAVGNMLVIEDPVAKRNLAGFVELRRQLKTPLALHTGDPKAMIQAVRMDACGIFNTGPAPSMLSFVENCYLAAAAGRPVWHGSGHELGILDAAMLHSCAAAANCTLPSDILSHQRVDDLIVKPINIHDSYAIVSDAPGLGVELDEDAVRRYRAA